MAADHNELREAIGLYVLGALDPAERTAVEAHLAECAECTAEVRTLRGVATSLLYGVPQIDPPAGLRDRVLGAVGSQAGIVVPRSDRGMTLPFPGRSDAARGAGDQGTTAGSPQGRGIAGRAGWLAIAALLLLAAGLGSYGARLRQRVGLLEVELREAATRLDRTEQQLTVATRAAEGVQLRLAVLTAPDLRQVNLAGQPPAPRAAARGFWSGSRGLVFAATALPPLPTGQTYQLWYLTATVPVSAGLFSPDAGGTIAGTFDPPPAGRTPTGLAVSLEPAGGVPAPTGAIYLAGTTQ
jgi:anti-sigma-K factor RskA